MGVEPPFMYDPPAKHTANNPSHKPFNPKAITQAASYASLPQPRRPKREPGPLVNFNQHPDSYLILPYGNLNLKPMSPRTKGRVKWGRWVQLGLRCGQLVGALGLLFLVLCVRGVEEATGWLVRVPPGVAIAHTTYAIYHLARRAVGRTPASSASYMLFATAADATLIPFMVFTALLSRQQHQLGSGGGMKWRTVFPDASTKLVLATYLTATVNGFSHVVSFLLSVYLALVFRKIASMPPDMNPLEDNLTSRHKKKHSSVSSFAPTADSHRTSAAMEETLPPPTIPFLHTRTNSTESFSSFPSSAPPSPTKGGQPSTPTSSKRGSRADLPSQQASSSSHHPNYSHRSPTRQTPLDLKRSSYTHAPSTPPKRASARPPHSNPTPTTTTTTTTTTPTKAQTASLLNDNWFTYYPSPTSDAEQDENRPPRQPSPQRNLLPAALRRGPGATAAGHAYSPLPQPLESHPPTPPPRAPPSTASSTYSQASSLTSASSHYTTASSRPGTGSTVTPGAHAPLGPATPNAARASPAAKQRSYAGLKPGWEMGTYVDLPPASGSASGSGGARAVSTGAEVGDVVPAGGRRREVSGKVVEEGRGGGGGGSGSGSGSASASVTGTGTGTGTGAGAAGWARWHRRGV